MTPTHTPGTVTAQAVVTVGSKQHALPVITARSPVIALVMSWAKARRYIRKAGLDLAVISVHVTQPHEGVKR